MKAGCDFDVDGGQPRHRPRTAKYAAGPGSGAGGGGSDRKGCGRMSAEAPGRPLTHWTAETGVKRESPRSDVTPALLAALAPDVERIGPDTVHTVFAVPGTEGWLWHAVAADGALRATVWEGLRWPEVVPTMAGQRLCYPDNALVFGVAAPPRGNWAIRWLWNRRAAKCWDEVCGLAALGSGIDPAQPPQPPWLLSALGSDAARHPDAMLWLPDFCRCVAWAWIERTALVSAR